MGVASDAVEHATIRQYCKSLRTPTIGAQFGVLACMFHQSGDQGDLGSRNRIWEVWVRIGHVWSDSAVSMNASCCVFGFRRA